MKTKIVLLIPYILMTLVGGLVSGEPTFEEYILYNITENEWNTNEVMTVSAPVVGMNEEGNKDIPNAWTKIFILSPKEKENGKYYLKVDKDSLMALVAGSCTRRGLKSFAWSCGCEGGWQKETASAITMNISVYANGEKCGELTSDIGAEEAPVMDCENTSITGYRENFSIITCKLLVGDFCSKGSKDPSKTIACTSENYYTDTSSHCWTGYTADLDGDGNPENYTYDETCNVSGYIEYKGANEESCSGEGNVAGNIVRGHIDCPVDAENDVVITANTSCTGTIHTEGAIQVGRVSCHVSKTGNVHCECSGATVPYSYDTAIGINRIDAADLSAYVTHADFMDGYCDAYENSSECCAWLNISPSVRSAMVGDALYDYKDTYPEHILYPKKSGNESVERIYSYYDLYDWGNRSWSYEDPNFYDFVYWVWERPSDVERVQHVIRQIDTLNDSGIYEICFETPQEECTNESIGYVACYLLSNGTVECEEPLDACAAPLIVNNRTVNITEIDTRTITRIDATLIDNGDGTYVLDVQLLCWNPSCMCWVPCNGTGLNVTIAFLNWNFKEVADLDENGTLTYKFKVHMSDQVKVIFDGDNKHRPTHKILWFVAYPDVIEWWWWFLLLLIVLFIIFMLWRYVQGQSIYPMEVIKDIADTFRGRGRI